MFGLTPMCHYCQSFSIPATGKDIYPHRKDLASLAFFSCPTCDAYVGCHEITGKPLGRLANATLRKAKSAVHEVFDMIWKEKYKTRHESYMWLAHALAIDEDDCHIGFFDELGCQNALKHINVFWQKTLQEEMNLSDDAF
jgi:hypothetical protein